MIKTLILYFLSIKATHGYEIQKFIQINQLDSYTKIQSGSIYYALGKLEKEGLITLYKEVSIGAKERKVYQITEAGKEALSQSLKEEISKDIYDIGSDKFIIYPVLSSMGKPAIISQVKSHLSVLEKKKKDVLKWQNIKEDKTTLKVESLCYEMMKSSLEAQIKWHEALLEELDECLDYSCQIRELIKKVDFSSVSDCAEIQKDLLKTATQKDDIQRLKQEILNNPNEAEEKLEELIKLMKQ